MSFMGRVIAGAILGVLALGMGGVAAWNSTMEQRAMQATPDNPNPQPPQGGVGTTAPAAGALISGLLAIAAQFWKPTDPKQQAIKRQLDALATLFADGALGQIGPIWKEITKNGIPSALDARIQWDGQTPYFLRWGKIVEETTPKEGGR